MKHLAPIVIVVSMAGTCCVVAATLCAFYYTLYRHGETKMDYLERRVEWLEAHKPLYVVPLRVRGAVSTTDQEEVASSFIGAGPATGTGYQVFQPAAKTGPVVGPEFRLPAGSTDRHEFDIVVQDSFGSVVDAWAADFQPCRDLAAFEEFRVYRPAHTTNVLRLAVQARPKASVRMEFYIVVLRESKSL
jgi:hypothetical protein